MALSGCILRMLSLLGRKDAILLILGYSALYSSISYSQFNNPPVNTISGTVTIIDRDGDELKDRSNAVIFIDGLSEEQQVQEKKNIPTMSHKGRIFSPRVLPIVKGEVIDFFNDDTIYHNVFSLSKANPFDLGIYPQGTSKLVTFSRPGLVKLYCNIHPKMVSNILVLNNNLFAKTGVDGTFEIKNIPDSEFTLRVWYEYSDVFSRQVSVKDGKRFIETFTIKATKKIRAHKNKFGKPYRRKY